MKLMAVFVLICSLHVSAESLSQTVTIRVNNQAIELILKEAKAQTGYNFLYNDRVFEGLAKQSIQAQNMPIQKFLDDLLKRNQLNYVINGGNILITPGQNSDYSINQRDEQLVHGQVTDSAGMALTGVHIRALSDRMDSQGSTRVETSTDQQGKFSIRAEVGTTLVFSSLGYAETKVQVIKDQFLKIVMHQHVDRLEEVVVVGYGTQKRKDVTGAISSIPKERIDMVPNTNIAQLIQGAVPGVIVQQSQGGSNPQSTMMIRGRNSILASNDPLIILDGIPYSGSLSDINANEITNIEVLKDASSAAIYGSRGANGVIIVSTKAGETVRGARITYDGKYSIQKANNFPRFMSPEQFYQFKETREPGNVTPSEQQNYENKSWTDWVDFALRDGKAMHNNLSVHGSSGKTNYYVSGNFLNVEGQTLNDSYERLNGKLGLQTSLFEFVKLGANFHVVSSDFGDAPISWEDILRINPLTNGFDENGKPVLYPWPEFIDIANPLDPINYQYQNKSMQLFSNNFLEVRVPDINGLVYRANFGYQQTHAQMSNYANRNTSLGLAQKGYFTSEDGLKEYLSLEHILTYKRQLGKHLLDATAVYGYETGRSNNTLMEASGFPNDFIEKYSIGQASFLKPGFDYSKTVLIGQMLRFNYAYDSRYLVTLTGRRDGYSGFGTNKKWGLFPSVAVGWNISEENFGLQELFQELKLRASYGINGNQAVNAYETISRLGEHNMINGATSLPGYVPIKLGQDDLGWESSKSVNFGLDFSVWKGKLSGTLNYYNTDTYDLLLNRTISPVHGISKITQNIGKTNNTGVELGLEMNIRTTSDLQWIASGNLGSNKNRIVSLYGILDENGKEVDDYANSWFIGKPISSNFNQKFMGVWQLDEESLAKEYGNVPGDAKALDINKDGVINADDRTFLGHRDPSFTWGLNNTIRYKSFGLSVFVHGVHGVTRLNSLLQDASSSSGVRRNVIQKNWWTPENPTNEFYANTIQTYALPIYEDASFIRLKDITLSYQVQESISSRIKMKQLRFYVNMRNLHTWTKWSTNDPELDFGRGAAPLAKEWVLGLNFNF